MVKTSVLDYIYLLGKKILVLKKNGQILDPKHLSCLFLLIVYGQKYQIYKLKADVDYPASVINGARCSESLLDYIDLLEKKKKS